MKQFLRLLLAVGVIAFAASITAASCGKTPDAGGGNNNNNANNSGGGNGGDGNGGGTPTPTPPPTGTITIGNFAVNTAKLATQVGGNDRVIINASQFPAAGALVLNQSGTDLIRTAPNSVARVFDLTITGGGATGAATGGMMIMDIGSRAKFADIAMTTAPTTTSAGTGSVYNIISTTSPAANIFKAGLNIFGIFIDGTAPTSNDPNTAPFAFSKTGVSIADPRPIFFCFSTISTITSTTPAATVALTGGQTASCYVGSEPAAFTGTGITTWFTALTNNANLKKRFYFTVAGMRTDSKALSEVVKSLTGATDAAKVTAFMNGLTTAKMETIRKDNITAFKKIMVEVVTDAVFTAP